MSEELRLIQVYLEDINNSLRDTSTEDIMILFRRLILKEEEFLKVLQSTAYGRKSYISFIEKITKAQGGIKSAMPYFRARQETFLNTVNKSIKEHDPKLMYAVPINYRFCLFAMEYLKDRALNKKQKKNEVSVPDKKSGIDRKLEDLFVDIKSLREEIINKHLYLSLNRAKVHRKSTYGMSIEFEDLVQISNEALVVAVDKYVMAEESSSFHAMAIGRIISSLIINGTLVSAATVGAHAQKKLYQIRKLLQKNPDFRSKDISDALSIAEDEVVDLLSVSHYKSLDETIGEDTDTKYSDIIPDENTESQYDHVEKKSLRNILNKGFKVLSIVERKVLILKGVRFDE